MTRPASEGDCGLLDCGGCALVARCRLTGVLGHAKRAFHAALDAYSIADVAARPEELPLARLVN